MTEELQRCERVIVWQQQCEDLCQSFRFFLENLAFKKVWRLVPWNVWPIDTSLHTVHTITRSCEDKSVNRWISILRNFFCDVLYVKKSHQNHAIHLKSLSDTLNLWYFECMFMWYEHVYDVVRTGISEVRKWVVRRDVRMNNPVTGCCIASSITCRTKNSHLTSLPELPIILDLTLTCEPRIQ